MTNLLYKAVNVTTDEKITIEAYQQSTVPAASFGNNGAVALISASDIYLKENGTWKEIDTVQFNNYVKNRMLCFITTNKITLSRARVNDLCIENDIAFWLSKSPATTAANWVKHNQEAFNQQATSSLTDINQRVNSAIWGTVAANQELNLIERIKLIEKTKDELRQSITDKGSDPGSDFTKYPDAVTNFVFAPYAFSVTGGTPIDISTKKGYFINTMTNATPSGVPAQNILVNESQGWTTGYTMYYNGDFKATRVFNAVWNDYAEFFEKDVDCSFAAGDVIVLNPETNKFRVSNYVNDPLAIGVVSDNFGSIVGGIYETIEENLKHFIPVSLAGRVKVKTKEKVEVGNLLVSSENGKAEVMKDYAKSFGCIIGKVIQVIDENNAMIMVMRA